MMSRKRSFFLLLSNQSIASAGDIFYLLSIISVVYERTSSVFLVSFIPFINTFSRFLGGLFAPWILEKGNLRSILASASTGKGLLLMTLPVLLLTNVGSSFLIWALIIVSLIAVVDSWITPARNASFQTPAAPSMTETLQWDGGMYGSIARCAPCLLSTASLL